LSGTWLTAALAMIDLGGGSRKLSQFGDAVLSGGGLSTPAVD